MIKLCENLPQEGGTIFENIIIANSKINSVLYENIICSISGGADSDIVMDICRKLDVNKKITYVWFDTGLEYEATKRHIKDLEKKYHVRIEEYKALTPIPISCSRYGQPFLSKTISEFIERLQRHGFKWEDEPFPDLLKKYPKCKAALRWWCNEWEGGDRFNINRRKYLKEFMIEHPPESIGLKVSPKCCDGAKKDVIHKIVKERKFDLSISGIRKSEGGARGTAYRNCFNASGKMDCDEYRPIFWYTEKDKKTYNECFDVKNSDCYCVYGLKRTGCAGCPFGQNFEEELRIMKEYEPKLFIAANNIFGASYQYTRMYKEYSKRKEEVKKGYEQMTLF